MKLKHIGFAATAVAVLASCADQMDYEEYSVYDADYIAEKWDKVSGVVMRAYYDLDYDFGNMYSGAMLSSATDESVYSVKGNAIEDFYNGSWSPTNAKNSIWTSSYEAISYCNLFLDEFNGLTFPDYELDEHYTAYKHWYDNFQYEARWLRAYYYFNLVRQYGDVPLKTANMTADEANALPRASADEVFDFIDQECEAIAGVIVKDCSNLGTALSAGEIGKENGRANDLAVLALRARAALYHASPLFNPGNDQSRWEHAKECTQMLLDSCESRGMGLVADYSTLFDKDNFKNGLSEIIFCRRVSAANSFEKWNFPTGMTNASGGNCPSQNLVDAYEMTNGKLISDPESGYDPQNPYVDRDARFAATVAVNGEHWPDAISNVDTVGFQSYVGGSNGLPLTNATPTSYYLKKYVNGAQVISGSSTTTSIHSWVVYRLGEFYLNMAEILMNLGDNAGALTYVNKVRARAGQPALTEDQLTTDRYQNERFVELAFEGHRFFDVRRWKEAPKFFTSIKSMTITLNADSTFTYTTSVDNSTRNTWDDKMYLFPIPQSEMMKNQGGWSQNPGW